MAPDELRYAFDRLRRGRDTAGTTGSGIGLAVVRELVTAHGGTVVLDSPDEGGLIVTIRLPLAGAVARPHRLNGPDFRAGRASRRP